MWSILDKVTDWIGGLAACMYFAIGLIVTYEVVMRYVFTAPTIWVDEVSRVTQIWATLIAGCYVLKHRELIVIDAFFRDPETPARKLVETFSLVVIFIFAMVTAKYGFDLWLKAVKSGHTTDTFLATPKWFTHGSLWIGFGLLALQSILELVRLWLHGVPLPADHVEH